MRAADHGGTVSARSRSTSVALLIVAASVLSLLAVLSPSVLVVSASSSMQPQYANANMHEIERALNYLSSVGIQGTYCHSTSSNLGPMVPKCDDEEYIIGHARFMQEEEEESEEFHGGGGANFYIINGGMAAICVTLAALAAGLTMGLLSLDPLMLLIKIRAGSSKAERDQAAVLLPVVQQHHRLLVSLLLMNACANEALPLFLDKLVPSYVAVILSVTLVLFFGEIIPSAVFTGPNQMKIASSLVPLVRTIMIVLSPLAYPIAKILDHVLHDDDDAHGMNLYNRGELTALVRIQYEERMASKQRRKAEMAKLKETSSAPSALRGDGTASSSQSIRSIDSLTMRGIKHGIEAHWLQRHDTVRSESNTGRGSRHPLIRTPSWHRDEITLVEGALGLKSKKAIDCYTPMRKVFMIPSNMILNQRNIVNLYSKGFSRVPVYIPSASRKGSKDDPEQKAICGVLITKQLIVIHASDDRVVSTMPLLQPFCISPSTNLVDLINIFQAGGTDTTKGGHMAFLCARPDEGNAALDKGDPIPPSAGMMGVITLEDVLEELLQEEILDELDKKEVESMRRAQWAAVKWRRFVRKQKEARLKEAVADIAEAADRPGFLTIVERVTSMVSGGNGSSTASIRASAKGDDIESGANEGAPLLSKKGDDEDEEDDDDGGEYIYGS